MSEKQNIIDPPEFEQTSRLLDELRAVIKHEKYDHLPVTRLVGVLELLKAEYIASWMKP